MMPENQYFLDTTVLIDYFCKDNAPEFENVRKWFDSVLTQPEDTIYTNTIILLEFAKFLFYQKMSKKKIRDTVRRLSSQYNLECVGFDKSDLFTTIEEFETLPLSPPCDVGELSLLPLRTRFNCIYVSSDDGALTTFKHIDRINPRKSKLVCAKGTDYIK